MNWGSPGALTFYFCVLVLVVSALPILSVIRNLRKVSEHAKRISQFPVFVQASMAKADMQRVSRSVALVPSYFQRTKAALAAARVAVAQTGLRQGVQSIRVAIAAIRLLMADVR